jgi:flagellar basal body-associated protein FliL
LTMDGKPFRKADLSPRAELVEARAELARLKSYDYADLSSKEFEDLSTVKHKEELRQRIQRLEYIVQDSAAPTAIVTVADLNKRNTEYWESRR